MTNKVGTNEIRYTETHNSQTSIIVGKFEIVDESVHTGGGGSTLCKTIELI